jgi:RNA polymerase sigma-70 factor (ECF subfamily)
MSVMSSDPLATVSTDALQRDSATAERAWSPPSWDEIVREHSARVYRLAYRLSGNHQDAEDLTQETFLRVFRSLASYTPGTFEGWLHRITTNLFLDQARRRTRIRMEAMGEDAARVASPDDADRPERGFEHANLDNDVQRALDALRPEYRAAVWAGVAQRVGNELAPLPAGTAFTGVWDVESETFGTRQPIFRYEFGEGSTMNIFLLQGDPQRPEQTTYAVGGEGRLTMWDETYHAATTPDGQLVVFNGDSSLLLIATRR